MEDHKLHTDQEEPEASGPAHTTERSLVSHDEASASVGYAGSRFEIRGALGEGGMGVVYRAWDRVRGMEVALKLLPRAEPEALLRFKREFRALTGIQHPNLVTLYELVHERGRWMFTMELVEGLDLRAFMRRGAPTAPMPTASTGPEALLMFQHRDTPATAMDTPPVVSGLGGPIAAGSAPHTRASGSAAAPVLEAEALRGIFADVSAAIHALHGHGRVHCDLKPSNIMVEHGTGRVVILDFGLVRSTDDGGVIGGTGAAGTPLYMAPEQIRKERVGPAADWYALGIMLHEALTGHPPLDGLDQRALMLHKQRHAPPPIVGASGEWGELAELYRRLTALDPDARPTHSAILLALGRTPPAPHPNPQRAEQTLCLGRDQVLRTLTAAYDACAEGRPGVVWMHGPSGIGKTTVADTFARRLSQTHAPLILRGRCYAQESVPFKALDGVIDALCAHLSSLPAHTVAASLPEDSDALAQTFSVLRRLPALADLPRRAGDPPEATLRRSTRALKALLGNLSAQGRPVVIMIDDLQWGDLDSAQMLAAVLAPPQAPAVLLVGAFRSDQARDSPFLQELGARDLGHAAPVDLPLAPLSTAAATALADQLGAGERSAELVAESKGHPYFLTQLAKQRSGASSNLAALLREHVAALPDPTQALLRAAIVAGVPTPERVLARVAGVAHSIDDVERLVNEQLIQRRPSDAGFELEPWHDRIRESLSATLDPADTIKLHRSLAQALLELAPSVKPERLGRHWLGAQEHGKARAAFLTAANQAFDEAAFAHAADLFAQAAELAGPDLTRDQKTRHASALYLSGQTNRAAQLKLSLVNALAPDDPERGLAACWLAEAGFMRQAEHTIRQLLKANGIKPPSPLRAFVGHARLQRHILRHWKPNRSGFSHTTRPRDLHTNHVLHHALRTYITLNPAVSGYLAMRGYTWALTTKSSHVLALWTLWLASQMAARGGAARDQVNAILREGKRLIDAAVEDRRALELAYLSVKGGMHGRLGEWRSIHALYSGLLDRVIHANNALVPLQLNIVTWNHLRPLFAMGRLPEMTHHAHQYRAFNRHHDRGVDMVTGAFLAVSALAEDDVAEGLRQLEHFAPFDRVPGYSTGHFIGLLTHCRVHLYQQRPRVSLERYRAERWRLVRAGLLFPQEHRIWLGHLLARLHMTAVRLGEGGSLRKATTLKRRLSKEESVWGAAMTRSLQAGLAMMRSRHNHAERDLYAAAEAFDRVDMGLFAASCRHHLGRCFGDADAAAQARAAFAQAGVVSPQRWADAWVPGFWSA